MKQNNEPEAQVRAVLEEWAKATRENRNDDILLNHARDLVIFDVLPPMKYESSESYRQSWDDWQPETQGEMQFDLENLTIEASSEMAFAHCFIRCGGTMANGHTFEDLVRATFCLRKTEDSWLVVHQHVSKPFQMTG